jgi:5,10-methylenetetrahydromethanopterin reductase
MSSHTPALGCAFPPSNDIAQHARTAEALGYSRMWIFDSPALYGDVWVALARAAESTDRLAVAAGVAVPFLRHPMVTASAIATLENIAPGRVAVAFGTGYTAARAMGRKPMRWTDLATYVRQVRGLLAGDTVVIDGSHTRMIHSPGYAPQRPLQTPLFVAPTGPKGFAVARDVGDGIIVISPPGSTEWSTCALLCSGLVLEPGDDHTTARVVDALGPGYATRAHALWEMGSEAVTSLPGGREWLADLESRFDEADRHWAVHEGHLAAVSDRDCGLVAQAGPALLNQGWTGDPATIRRRAIEVAESGVTELAYGPVGADTAGQLAAFASAVRGD